MKSHRITNEERELWLMNDPLLYNLWKDSGLPKRRYIKELRTLIDSVIEEQTNGAWESYKRKE